MCTHEKKNIDSKGYFPLSKTHYNFRQVTESLQIRNFLFHDTKEDQNEISKT